MAESLELSFSVLKIAQKVVEIPELLELIILCLPQRDILTVRQTNKTWNKVVHDSLHIRQKLFMDADGTPVRPLAYDGYEARSEVKIYNKNSLELNAMISWKAETDSHWNSMDDRGIPFIAFKHTISPPTGPDGGKASNGRFFIGNQFLTQPPCIGVTVRNCRVWKNPRLTDLFSCSAWNPRGVTLHDIWEARKKLLETFETYGLATANESVNEFVEWKPPDSVVEVMVVGFEV